MLVRGRKVFWSDPVEMNDTDQVRLEHPLSAVAASLIRRWIFARRKSAGIFRYSKKNYSNSYNNSFAASKLP